MIAVWLLAVALAMDAFAVALVEGARRRPAAGATLAIALAFGAAQGVMALIGWGLGAAMIAVIAAFDHWIAFAVLAFLGVQMIRAGEHVEARAPLKGMSLAAAAIATSLDALGAGITLPTLTTAPLAAAGVIALVTFVLALGAVQLGRRAGERFGRPAEIAGGLVLIALGCGILAEHTGVW